VDVVSHPGEGMNSTTRNFGIFMQPIKVEEIILISEKTCLAVVAPLNDMEWDSRIN
jgi:hypothetical protein